MEVEIANDIESQKHASYQAHAPNNFSKKPVHPLTLKFQDVVYKVQLGESKCMSLKKTPSSPTSTKERVILKGTTGIVKPGEMLAMLGPSGSGKTTLLTALGGRLGGNLKGSITYNGKPYSNQTKRCTGFVTQDDVLYAHLTVTETLVYTALLRLPNSLTKEEKISQAECVVLQLGLSKCKDSMIGGPFMRGVSGGERKRVSIGQEMLIDPSLLLLDEPTSGLDSTTAQRIVSTLSDLAHGGRTIVTTIHQPSSRLFYMFDKVLLLSDGNTLYFGSGSQVMEYFKSIGFAPSVPMNPADFLLDLANGVSPDELEDPISMKEKLILGYNNHHTSREEEIQAKIEDGIVEDKEPRKMGKWATNWWQQFSVLLRRGLKERRHEMVDYVNIAQVVIIAFIAGLLWWQSNLAHLQDQIGLLYFSSSFWGFFPLFQAIFTFPPERAILTKERFSGMYRLSSYFMARTVSDLPFQLMLPTVYVIITYLMAGLKRSFISFFQYLFTILFCIIVAQGLGLALGALVMDLKKATTIGSVLMLSFVLAGGYYLQHMPPFISWIKYLSICNYNYKLLLDSQYNLEGIYPCGNNTVCLIKDFPPIKTMGLNGKLSSIIALLLMCFFYRLIAYVALMRIGVTKTKTT